MDPERSAVHRRQNLDFARVADAKASHQPMLYELLDRSEHIFGCIAFEKKEIALGIVLRLGHLAAIELMRVGYDQALPRLAINLAQLRDRHQPRRDYVFEDAAGPDRRQLVAIAHQQQ